MVNVSDLGFSPLTSHRAADLVRLSPAVRPEVIGERGSGGSRVRVQHPRRVAAPAGAAVVGRPQVVVVARADLVRLGLERVLREGGAGVAVVAGEPRSAPSVVQELMPDVVLVDATSHGVPHEGLRGLLRAMGSARSLVLVEAGDDRVALDALAAGASGCVDADATPDEIVAAVRAAARGESFLSPSIARPLARRLGLLRPRTVSTPELTPRERQVLRLVVRGWDNARVGEALFVSSATIKHHLANIFTKLDVDNRVQAAVRAVEEDLLEAP
jgi:DNA-binding NarL/FixJ family response regulator